MMTRKASLLVGSLLVLATVGCAEDDSSGPGILVLDVGAADTMEGHYDRYGVIYGVLLDTVDQTHRLTIIDTDGRTILALDAREAPDGLDGALDWPAMDLTGEDELASLRSVFVGLAGAARIWGEGDGRTAPAWVVQALELPIILVPPPSSEDGASLDVDPPRHIP